jgi:hypothetical protein
VGWQRFGTAGFARIGPARIEFVRALGRTRWRARWRRLAVPRREPPPAEPRFLLSRVDDVGNGDGGSGPESLARDAS